MEEVVMFNWWLLVVLFVGLVVVATQAEGTER